VARPELVEPDLQRFEEERLGRRQIADLA